MKFKDGDRVKGVYNDPSDIGTIKIEGGDYLIIYDNEPEIEYRILDDEYLEKKGENNQKKT